MQLEVSFRSSFFPPIQEKRERKRGVTRVIYTFSNFKLRHHIVEYKIILVVIFICSLLMRLSKHGNMLFVEE